MAILTYDPNPIVYPPGTDKQEEAQNTAIAAGGGGGGGSTNASDLVSGTLAVSRLPAIPISQITSLQSSLDNKSNVGHSQAATTITGLAAIALSGLYSDLIGKPTLSTVATSGVYSDLTGKPTLATVSSTGAYSDLTGKPTLSTVAGTGAYADLLSKPTLATVATSGVYSDLTGKPTIPAAQVNSDWTAGSGLTQILNKPSLSTVATSGAYADLSGVPVTYGIQYRQTGVTTTSGSNLVITHSFGANTGIDRIIGYETGTRVSVDLPFDTTSMTDTQITVQPVVSTTYTILVLGHKLT